MNNLRNSMAPIFVRNLFTQMAIGKRSNLLSCLFYLQITLVCFQNCFVDTSSRECTFGIQWLNFLCPCVGDHSCQTRKVAASGLHAFVCRAAMSSLLTPPINSPSHRNYPNPTFLNTFAGLLQSSKQKRFALAAMFVESLSLEGQWTICLFGTVAFAMMRGCTV